MPFNTIELIHAAEIVAQQENMKVAMTCSLKSAGFTGATTFAGGILGGPIGLGIGAFFGGICSMIASRGQFKSLVSIIKEDLTEEQKEKLAYHLHNAVKDFDINDVVALSALIMSDRALYGAVKQGLVHFVENDLKIQLSLL